jgi:hypothetical protein
MDILDTVRSDLKGATMARQRQVADESGVPWPTLRKIVDGDTANPQWDTVKKLSTYYANNPPATRPAPDDAPKQQAASAGDRRPRQMH